MWTNYHELWSKQFKHVISKLLLSRMFLCPEYFTVDCGHVTHPRCLSLLLFFESKQRLDSSIVFTLVSQIVFHVLG